ncbi:MAG: hypothetical protein WCD37_14430 [Chloroflexia bacterium]
MSDNNLVGNDELDELKPEAGDWAHTATKVALPVAATFAGGALAGPLGAILAGAIGPAAGEFFATVFTPPLTKRKDKWLADFYTDFQALQAQVEGLTPEKLAQNDAFVSLFLQASQIAMRTHREEKLRALRNGVLRTALPNPPDEELTSLFLNMIDGFTPSHIRFFSFVYSPSSYANRHGIPYQRQQDHLPMSWYVNNFFPELRPIEGEVLRDQIVRDFYNAGLINVQSLEDLSMRDAILMKHVTKLGQRFSSFLSSPIQKPSQP